LKRRRLCESCKNLQSASEGRRREPAPALPAAEIRGRRILVLDEERGLALAVVMLDRGGGTTPGTQTASTRPSTNMAMALFKIKAGRIASVDMLERPVPFGMSSGWVE